MLYCTYSWLSSKSRGGGAKRKKEEAAPSKHVFESRLEQLLQWCGGPAFDLTLTLTLPLPPTLPLPRCGGPTFDLTLTLPLTPYPYPYP